MPCHLSNAWYISSLSEIFISSGTIVREVESCYCRRHSRFLGDDNGQMRHERDASAYQLVIVIAPSYEWAGSRRTMTV